MAAGFFWGYLIFLLDSLLLIAIVELGFDKERRQIPNKGKKRVVILLLFAKAFFLYASFFLVNAIFSFNLPALAAGAATSLACVAIALLWRDRLSQVKRGTIYDK